MLEKRRVLAAMKSIGMAVMAEAAGDTEVRRDTGGLKLVKLLFVDIELEVQLPALRIQLGQMCKSQTSSVCDPNPLRRDHRIKR